MRNPDYQPLTDEQLARIDELCDRFDQELFQGNAPRISDFLVDASESAQDRLLAELVAMEVEYRIQQGEVPEQDEYIQQFSQQVDVIAGVFARDATTPLAGSNTISKSVPVPPELENFRLIKQIGSGGMGVVWLADQLQPVKRRVALKLIKSELTSREVLARFDAEKQALAMMDHQNIARVLDAGTTNDDRPYFVMEWVDGVPITQYCDDQKLSVDERLNLFVAVCKAVQHAHQKGIIHRDLKPSNVLVTVIDGEAVPKVIDFGMAKAVEQNLLLTDVTLQTEFGQVVGTVRYMSPEQAELKGSVAEDIDTRTDIYSLGVMLYELLTGSTPIDKDTLGRNALMKILEIIRKEDPPRPSIRLSSSSGEVNSTISDLRRLHPARLQQLLRGELDWVVMKALEKDRARRYQTANDLGQDLANYLKGETVHARPPSTWYQVRKFAGRNRGLAASMLAIGIVLIAGITGTTFGLFRANEKTELADQEKMKAQRNERRALEAEELASTEAQRARDSEAASKFQLANARWDAQRARDARDLLHEIPVEYRENFEWHHCKRKFDGSDFTCYGHSLPVRGAAFNPTGTLVATCSIDSTIILWDANTGQEIKTLRGHEGTVEQVIFSPGGTQIASRSRDNVIKIWDLQSGLVTATLDRHEMQFVMIAYTLDGKELVSASSTATITRWDTSTGQEISKLQKYGAGVGVAFSPNCTRFLTREDAGIILWDALDGREIARQRNPIQWPKSTVFSPDGRYIAVAGHDTIALWDAELTEQLWSAYETCGWILGLSFSPDGSRIASGGSDRHVRVWDVQSGSEIMTLVGHGDEVVGVAYSPDGARLASASLDTTLKLWDARAGQNTLSIRAHSDRILGLAFNADGKRIVSASSDGSVKLWDISTGRVIAKVNGFFNENAPGARCVAISPNDAYIAFGGYDDNVRLLDGKTGAELNTLEGHEDTICSVAFPPDSKHLVSGSADNTVRIWEIESGNEVITLRGHAGRVNSVAYSPDGSRVASASADATIKIWDVESGNEIMSLVGHRINVGDVAFSPDGKQIVSSSGDQSIRIWDAQSGEEISRLNGHAGAVVGVAFSPDGKRVASTGFDRMLKLWNVQTGRELLTMYRSNLGVNGVAFSPDGLRIAVGEDNGIIHFQDAPWEHELETSIGHTETPYEKAYHAAKIRFDPAWHLERATESVIAEHWYAATFHFALLVKNDVDQAQYVDELQSSITALRSQEEHMLEPHRTTFVQEALKIPPSNELPNPSFEEPKIQARRFEMSRALPGWKTTGQLFEIWSTGFMGVEAHDGKQFVELNATEEATLYRDLMGIEPGAEIDFSFAHRGRNGQDTLKLTITDLGTDNFAGGGDDQELFVKEYTTGKDAWAIYDSTTEPTIKALGNRVRFAYTAVHATGGRGPAKTEGNFLDAAKFGGREKSTSNRSH
jgi:WD40 repeat protein/serine/threonine protein kinase